MFITCLPFPDNFVLLSAEGRLQNSVIKLNEYCNKLLLTVNINKTKVMIINKGGRLHDNLNFTLDNETLEVVKEYRESLKRAMKAIFKIKKNYTPR